MTEMQPVDSVVAPLVALLDGVLTGVRRDVPGEVGTAVSIAHPSPERGAGQLQILAATGIGNILTPVTTGRLWGPSLMAAAGEEPIVTADLWQDPRWPHLTPDAVRAELPARLRDAVSRPLGVAAVPGVWDDQGVVVLSVYLERPADQHTLAVLSRHERLVTSAITIADVATRSTAETNQVLDALASRAIIDQAKGAIMTLRRCDADKAWSLLRLASQECNVKLREVAQALVEHISGRAPGHHPADTHQQTNATPAARQAAEVLWQALSDTPPTWPPIDGASRPLRDTGQLPTRTLEPENP